MGKIAVPLYQAYKLSMKFYHSDGDPALGEYPERLAVGQPRNLHLAKLRQQAVDAKLAHANWAARRIARYVITGIREGKVDIPARQYFDWLANDRNAMTRLGLYSVAEPLQPLALAAARASVLAQLRARS